MRRCLFPVLTAIALLGATGCSSTGSSAGPPRRTSTRPAPSSTSAAPHAAPRPPRVLLIGDSILDQEGNAAAFELRQAGVDARAIGVWGSGVIGIDAYDYGHTKPSGYWLARAKREVTSFAPDVVGVYMNHSYWPPYPHDAAGNAITDLGSPPGQQMIGQQARALITILRATGAEVFFITPAPAATSGSPDPSASNAIWRGYVPVLRAMHVAVADAARPLERPDGLRAESQAACDGTQQLVRPPGDVHLTRFGAGRAGTALASFVAGLVHVTLRGNAAPGDAVAALVATRDARGYWLVGCDGSVYRFGDARPLAGRRDAARSHGGAVAAVASPSGAGLWIVARDGTIVPTGDAPPLTFAPRPRAPLVAAVAFPRHRGLWAVTASAVVVAAGVSRVYRSAGTGRPASGIVGIVATRDGRGYWLAGADGAVTAYGDARVHGSAAPLRPGAPISGMAATPDDGGYWLVGRDGGVFAFGDAKFRGTAVWHTPPGPHGGDVAPPGPSVGIVARPGPVPGYWVFGTTGRVVALGAAGRYGGDNNLALDTQ